MRRRPTLAFSGHEGVSWKSWDEATDRAVRSLNTGSHQTLPSSNSAKWLDDLEVRPYVPQTVTPFLLESADDSAKRIVPWQ